MRQLHEFHIGIVIDVRRAVMQGKDSINSPRGSRQLQQRRLDPQADRMRNITQRLKKSDELNRIAETMITAHQDTFSGQRLAAPYRL